MHPARIPRRFPLRRLMTFTCGHNGETATGETKNISTTGVLFLTEAAVLVGTAISLKLHIRSVTNADKAIVLQAAGTVLRIEPQGQSVQVAAEIRLLDDLEGGFSKTCTVN